MPGRKDLEVGTYVVPLNRYRKAVVAADDPGAPPPDLPEIDARYQSSNVLVAAKRKPARLGFDARIIFYLTGTFTGANFTLYQDISRQLDVAEGHGIVVPEGDPVDPWPPAGPLWVECQKFVVSGPDMLVTDSLVPGIYVLKVTDFTGTTMDIYEQHTE